MPVRKAVIPAAGLGTRILPATKAIPKELLALVDKPMIQHVVEEAAGAGITDVVIVTSPDKPALIDHFSPAPALEEELERKKKTELLAKVRATTEIANVSFAIQREPLGLGHAVLQARDAVGAEPFAVLLPDELFFGPELVRALIERHERVGASVIAVMEMPPDEVSNYGVVDPEPLGVRGAPELLGVRGAPELLGVRGAPELMDDDFVRIKDFIEKPAADDAPSNLGSVGRYVLSPDVFDALDATDPGAGGEIQLTDGIAAVARDREAYAYIYKGPRRDAGRPLGYVEATVELALRHAELGEEFEAFLTDLARRGQA